MILIEEESQGHHCVTSCTILSICQPSTRFHDFNFLCVELAESDLYDFDYEKFHEEGVVKEAGSMPWGKELVEALKQDCLSYMLLML